MDTQTEAGSEKLNGDSEPQLERIGIGIGRAPGSQRTQFKPGNTARKKKSNSNEPPSPTREKPCRLLRDMRRVYQQDETRDRSPAQRILRVMLTSDPKGFLSQLAGLEKAHLSTLRKADDSSPGAVPDEEVEEQRDEGGERALALCRRALQEIREKVERENEAEQRARYEMLKKKFE